MIFRKILSKHQGWLVLDYLSTITDSVSKILATKKGNLWLINVNELSDKAAQNFSSQSWRDFILINSSM